MPPQKHPLKRRHCSRARNQTDPDLADLAHNLLRIDLKEFAVR